MNILLSAGYLPKEHFANINIEILLAKHLANMGHACYIVGLSNDAHGLLHASNNVTLHRLQKSKRFGNALAKLEDFVKAHEAEPRSEVIRKFVLQHPFSGMVILLNNKMSVMQKNEKSSYRKIIKSFLKDHEIDAIIGFAYPFDMVDAAIHDEFSGIKLYYQFDPHGLHQTVGMENQTKNIADEVAVIERSDFMFTTKVLYQEYAAHESYKHLMHKMQSVDFPALTKKETQSSSIIEFDKDCINLLFCGTLEDNHRNPRFLLDALTPVLERNKQVRLYFVGNLANSDEIKNIAPSVSTQIKTYGVVTNDVANATMQQADILVNIGNSMTNMTPSKIFDYFSFGKPIITTEKTQNCTAKPYFERYPLSLSLAEYKATDYTQELEDFILQSKDKSMNFDEVQEIFFEATPQYVAGKIDDAIKSVKGSR